MKVSTKVECTCLNCGVLFTVYPCHRRRGAGKYCSVKCRSNSSEYREYLGSRVSESLRRMDFTGEKNNNWRGGKTIGRNKLQSSKEYKDWRKAVYERDGYSCIHCGEKGNGKNLNADHIKPYALYPELVFDLDNGRTLCIDCHKETNTYGWKLFNDIKWRKRRA